MGENKSLTLTFVRGARRVTGSNFLLEAVDGGRATRILIDCGLIQGEQFCSPINTEPFSYDPKGIDAVFVTHAHADHIGLLPKLYREGCAAPLFATAPTLDLIPIMLEDGAMLIAREAKRCNYEPPYVSEDVSKLLPYMKKTDFGHPVSKGPITATFHNAGHILGSASSLIHAFGTRILFTGDLGRTPAILVPDRTPPEGEVDYLVTESVYGNRTHEEALRAEKTLVDAVMLAEKRRGTLLIPAFSLERTHIILSMLDALIARGAVPRLPVFMDSPLASKVTEVYRQHPSFMRAEMRSHMEKGDDPFSFPGLSVTTESEDSEGIHAVPSPKIIIAGSGMSHGGRIRAHELKYLPDPSSVILMVGYQSPGSLGRRIRDGASAVTIDGKKVNVRARVLTTGGFSAHADRDDLLNYAAEVSPKTAFVVLGEMASASFLAQRLSGFFGIKTVIPQEGETYELESEES